MTLSNYQEFKKWCHKHGLIAYGVLESAESHARLSGDYDESDFDYETYCKEKKCGRPLSVRFLFEKKAVYEFIDDETGVIRNCTLDEHLMDFERVGEIVEEAVYQFVEVE